jgi:hypothetical protein
MYHFPTSMLRHALILLLSVFSFTVLHAQVGINSEGDAPHGSAGLDVDFSDKGFLTPRMTEAERDAIADPADGLMLFNTTTGCFNYRLTGFWMALCGTCTPQPTQAAAGPDQSGVTGGTATLAGNTPTFGTGLWSVVSGPGGSFSDDTSPVSLFTGTPGETYVLRWTITAACGSTQDEVTVSFEPAYTNYPTGNEAYWTEKDLGYGPVTVGGGSVVYTYDAGTGQYKNGNTVLLPNLVASQNGGTVDATSFYGYSGGSPSDSNYQWDAQALAPENRGTGYNALFDATNMFVSPMSSASMPHYCKIMQYNYPGGTCTTNSSITIDGPNSTLAYSGYSPGSGTYIPYNGQEYVHAGAIKGSSWDEYVSQQQLDATPNAGYCVTTYGKGWRLPTAMEAGHYTDTYFSAGLGWDDAFKGNTTRYLWTSTRFDVYNFHRMVLRSNDGYWYISWQNQDLVGVDGEYGYVRCVYPGY